MLKRKYSNRSNWKRMVEWEYAQKFLNDGNHQRFITLLHLKKVTDPLMVTYEGLTDDQEVYKEKHAAHTHAR